MIRMVHLLGLRHRSGGSSVPASPAVRARGGGTLPRQVLPAAHSSDRDEDEVADARNPSLGAARIRERQRCAAIFSSPYAAARLDMAAHYAFETDLGRKEACKALARLAAGGATATRGTARSAIAKRWQAAAKRTGLSDR
jgi:hypothetical protein